MRHNYFFIILLLLFGASHNISGQIIYNADFSNDGDGFADHTSAAPPVAGPTSVGPFGSISNQWNLSYDTTPNTDGSTNSFKVSGGALISDDWGGQGIFTSQAIDISSVTTVSIAALGANSGANDGKFTYFYILDNGTRVETVIGATSNGDAVNYAVNNLDVSGSNTIQVGFEFSENGSGDGYTVNSFTVTASSSPVVSFDAASSSQNETNATFNTLLPVTFSNYNADVTIGVTVNAGSTAEPSDYTLNTSSITFTGNGTENISLDINDDADFESETIILDIAVTSGNANITIAQHTVTISDDDLPIVINEILADPDSSNGDANGDGIVSTTEDEFLEIYNISGADLDISGWTIADAIRVRHTFPNGTIIPANEAIVIFGGGTPVTVPGIVQVASTNALELNNGGDTITIKNNTGATVLVENYASAGNNQSIARNDDINGAFVNHSNIPTNPVIFSPGRDNTDNTPFSSNLKWTGVTDTNWDTATNWIGNTAPTSTSNVIIPANLTNYPTISAPITVSTINIESGASLIANATVTGTVTYQRNLPTNNWYLVSSPVAGETIENLISNHTFASGTGANIGIAPYKNDGSAWNYQTNAATGAIASGQGISVKTATASTIRFTGTAHTNNVLYPITKATNNLNLVGNPFTSYVNLGAFFTDNATGAVLSEATVWLWNQATNSYDLKMSGTDANFQIAPGQAFFVSAGANTNINFNTANQSHQADTFQKNNSTPEIQVVLYANENGKTTSTKLYYTNKATKGLDDGFDGTMFGGINYTYALYSQLVAENTGKNYAIQSLPSTDMENTIVPIGLKAEAGKEIIFSANSINLPNGLHVYLEDRSNGTFTNLSEKSHTVTLNNATNGTGQFYLHTTAQKLGIDEENSLLNHVSIYKSSPKILTIAGLQAKNASLNIFSLLGKKVVTQQFNSNGTTSISIPKLPAGIYLLALKTKSGKINKKIILE
ncbi:lamin tail domain-containing protein [Tenacibaculum maritimum]|uniref:lamin tail domain-containing protein n=1 Tax=Tenacibaculum maritimum TaxID=107401 RepID=UPI001E4EF583|nr:lamin tail domain-containing protein [Tenacibaculum maritimum]MCD9586085.1 lamin tail domain-containing protein [Tenacibaculum maritimum]MCD9611737.1 lamin tail domain-containing protein [Tenacibaculum maritimum]MCD9621119.1 lamin tail domain-containing protein [Tenacibaculum maritimum]MCD9627362.1 lamin tail domain-containing protein [Tenacibaculum maritimum]MCD9629819.1 lamin tail domain-containing protein [Tenacibaculum maritimum]